MTPMEEDDPLMRAIAALPRVRQDEGAARELRARCRARLERPPVRLPVTVEPAAVGTVCAIYAWQVVVAAIRSSGG